jgi:hypothetical protein
VFDATTEGVLKIPAPTTIPIISTIASINLKVGFGTELGSDIMILVIYWYSRINPKIKDIKYRGK